MIRDKFTLGDPLCAGWAPAQRRRQETKGERNKSVAYDAVHTTNAKSLDVTIC